MNGMDQERSVKVCILSFTMFTETGEKVATNSENWRTKARYRKGSGE